MPISDMRLFEMMLNAVHFVAPPQNAAIKVSVQVRTRHGATTFQKRETAARLVNNAAVYFFTLQAAAGRIICPQFQRSSAHVLSL